MSAFKALFDCFGNEWGQLKPEYRGQVMVMGGAATGKKQVLGSFCCIRLDSSFFVWEIGGIRQRKPNVVSIVFQTKTSHAFFFFILPFFFKFHEVGYEHAMDIVDV